MPPLLLKVNIDITIWPAYYLIWRNAAHKYLLAVESFPQFDISDMTLLLLSRLRSRWESDSWQQAETRTDEAVMILNDSDSDKNVWMKYFIFLVWGQLGVRIRVTCLFLTNSFEI